MLEASVGDLLHHLGIGQEPPCRLYMPWVPQKPPWASTIKLQWRSGSCRCFCSISSHPQHELPRNLNATNVTLGQHFQTGIPVSDCPSEKQVHFCTFSTDIPKEQAKAVRFSFQLLSCYSAHVQPFGEHRCIAVHLLVIQHFCHTSTGGAMLFLKK